MTDWKNELKAIVAPVKEQDMTLTEMQAKWPGWRISSGNCAFGGRRAEAYREGSEPNSDHHGVVRADDSLALAALDGMLEKIDPDGAVRS